MRNQGNRFRRGRNDWHQRAAEFNDLAAHAHRVAATHHGKEDHWTAQELSKHAMEYSAKAYMYSQEAHRQSGGSSSEPAIPQAESVKQAKGGGKRSAKKK